MQHVERALFDLRRGLPVVLRYEAGLRLVAPLEGLSSACLDDVHSGGRGPARLLLTEQRTAHLAPTRGGPAALPLGPGDSREDLIRLACDPNARWPAARAPEPLDEADHAALALMRRGLLLPAAVAVTVNAAARAGVEQSVARGDWLALDVADVFVHQRAARSLLRRVSEADVPLETAARARFVVFREADGVREHVAILIGDHARWPDPVPVRLHSACLTGDLFGSLRCDCGPQLRTSVAAIAGRGGGVLLYLAQEGRGIGLANKMRAYQMQDEGLDTVDADRVLGFEKDERDYAVAREMLAQLDVARIDLLTNNPAKLHAMQTATIEVVGRSGVFGRLTPHNRRYLATKARRAGHWLDALLDEVE